MAKATNPFPEPPDSDKQFTKDELWASDTLPITSLGSGLKLVKRETVNFTKDFATSILDEKVMPPFKPDRALDQSHVNYLIQAMQQGTFRWEMVQLMTCTCNGKTYRMNGQHTAWARIYFDATSSNLPVNIYRYHAQTEEDMRGLYASIDRGRARNRANVINSYLFDSDKFKDFSKQTIKYLAEGLSLWLWEDHNHIRQHNADEVSYLLKTDYYNLAMKVGNFLVKANFSGDARHLRRSPVFAALFATYKKAEGDSELFWNAVKTGANLSSDDPRLKLRNQLMTAGLTKGRGDNHKISVNGDDMYGWAIQAWNSWRKQKPLICFRSAKAERIAAV